MGQPVKGEVSTIKKMLTTFNPRLRRSKVVLNSFCSCVSNTPKKLPWTPEVSFSKVIPQPRMLLQKSKSRGSFKQLKSFANAHGRRKLDKQMEMVNSDMKFIDFTSVLNCNLSNKSLTINPNSVELKGVFGIFRFPDKMESILPEAVSKTFQIHFLTPQTLAENKVHTKFVNLFHKEGIDPLYIQENQELNINGGQQLSSHA